MDTDKEKGEASHFSERQGSFSKFLRRATYVSLAVLAPVVAVRGQGIPMSGVSAWTRLSSRYLTITGSPIGNGTVNQSWIDIGIGKNVTASTWTNYDLGTNEINEQDFYLTFNGGMGSLSRGAKASWSASAQAYTFPTGIIPETFYFLVASARYDGAVAASLTDYHMLNGKMSMDKNLLMLVLSKGIDLHSSEKDFKISLIPESKIAYSNNLLGMNGMCYITPGASIELGLGKADIGLTIRRQFGLNGVKSFNVVDLHAGVRL